MNSKEKVSRMCELYSQGHSGPEVARIMNVSKSTVQRYVKLAGISRPFREALIATHKKGKIIKRPRDKASYTEEWRIKVREAQKKYHDEHAKGTSIKPSGYMVYTTGEFKDRNVHIVIMEKRLGRRLKPDECVHHIDNDKLNNDEDNLALMTVQGHARHHIIFRRESK